MHSDTPASYGPKNSEMRNTMHYEIHGLTSPNAPTIVLSSGLGGAAKFWQPQLADFTQDYRVITYDQYGTNKSVGELPANYSISDMADELAALLKKLEVQVCHFVGHALGGLVGLQLSLSKPDLLQSLVLVNAWSSPNPHTLRCFDIRKALLAANRKDMYLQLQALLLYPPDWIAANARHLEEEEAHLLNHFPNVDNLLARIAALSAFDIDGELPEIKTPTLAVANKDDTLVPWQRSQTLADAMPNAVLSVMEYGGHASSITVPSAFNKLVLEYLQRLRQRA
ncbi:pyrimidine utilization protein D [Alteromonas sp. KUL106]|uniref:pyrimidine utilization protein D n=1 Tax=Alteromonas sp. KUL106 TaxID=2480799 RepID=UPI0012E4D4C4|nr:pyrimidine utilization protein D [Alteromonas sp. KUL106]GFD69843.1 putative aminoacrylate hydrolase RutD [Alteromonas sp. KUL106]